MAMKNCIGKIALGENFIVVQNFSMRVKIIPKLLLAATLLCTSATAGVTIRYSPGIDGGTKISTPWGDYLAIEMADGVWVGTEEEYMHAKAVGFARADGYKEVTVNVDGKEQKTFVAKDLPHTSVGENSIDAISITPIFNVPSDKKLHRPPKPKGFEYVGIVWSQKQRASASVAIVQTEDKKVISPFHCVTEMGFYSCEFIVPHTSMLKPATVVFSSQKKRPGIIALPSIVKERYRELLIELKDSAKLKMPPSDEQKEDLLELHRLDPSIPETF